MLGGRRESEKTLGPWGLGATLWAYVAAQPESQRLAMRGARGRSPAAALAAGLRRGHSSRPSPSPPPSPFGRDRRGAARAVFMYDGG